MPPSDAGSRTLRILLAEDEFLIADLMREELETEGHAVLGPYNSIAAVNQALASEPFDLAILDVNLHGEMIYPAADTLAERGVPFSLLSGYGRHGLPERFEGSAVLSKPCNFDTLHAEIARLTREGARKP